MNKSIKTTLSRPSSSDDVKVIHHGLAKFNKDHFGYEEDSISIVSELNGEVVGGVYALIYDTDCWIRYLWVHEDLRGQGYGRGLVQDIESYAKINGLRRLSLSTWDFQAKPFYEKLGFNVDATIPNFIGGATSYFMTKSLDE